MYDVIVVVYLLLMHDVYYVSYKTVAYLPVHDIFYETATYLPVRDVCCITVG